jgi:hypothetical protein
MSTDAWTLEQRQLRQTTEHIQREAVFSASAAPVTSLAEALQRDDLAAAAGHARAFLASMPGWRAEESAFNALLTVCESPDSPFDDLERTLSALPNEDRRNAALDAYERRDWAGVEHALALDPQRRLQVYCERLLELVKRM